MGYDLTISGLNFSLDSDKSSAFILMNKLKLVLSNDVSYVNLKCESDNEWLTVALCYLFYGEYPDFTKPTKNYKPHNCRGCYASYVARAYILSFIFVWYPLKVSARPSILFHSFDDGNAILTFRIKDHTLDIELTSDDDSIKVNIPLGICDDLAKSIAPNVSNYDEYDRESGDIVDTNTDAINPDNINKILSLLPDFSFGY